MLFFLRSVGVGDWFAYFLSKIPVVGQQKYERKLCVSNFNLSRQLLKEMILQSSEARTTKLLKSVKSLQLEERNCVKVNSKQLLMREVLYFKFS